MRYTIMGLFMLCAPAIASAQSTSILSTEEVENQISFHPLDLLAKDKLAVDYERKIDENWTVLATPSLTLSNFSETTKEPATHSSRSHQAVGIDVGARFYPTGQAGKGFFFQPTLGYSYDLKKNDASNKTRHSVVGRGMIGWQVAFAHRAILTLAAGGEYTQRFDKSRRDDKETGSAQKGGFSPATSLTAGFAF